VRHWQIVIVVLVAMALAGIAGYSIGRDGDSRPVAEVTVPIAPDEGAASYRNRVRGLVAFTCEGTNGGIDHVDQVDLTVKFWSATFP